MLIVNLRLVDLEGFIPGNGVRYWEGQLLLVTEVGVGDVLGESVLGKVNPFLADWDSEALSGQQQKVVFVDMLVQLFFGVGG